MKWNNLSLRERSDLMKVYLENGITSLSEMKRHYNSFKEGGDTKASQTDNTIPIFSSVLASGSPQEFVEKTRYPVPYKAREVNERTGLPDGVRNITEDVQREAAYLYKPLAGREIIKDPQTGKIYTVETGPYFDRGELNLDGFEPVEYSQLRKNLSKRDYIGGEGYRKKALDRVPGLKRYISDLSNNYGIDRNLFMHRFLKEGWIDHRIKDYNESIPTSEQKTYWETVVNNPVNGFSDLGIDYAGANKEKDLYRMQRPVDYYTTKDINEKGKEVQSVSVANLADGLEFMAADLDFRRRELAKKGIGPDSLDIWTNAAFNMGLGHEALTERPDYIRRQYTYPNYYNDEEVRLLDTGLPAIGKNKFSGEDPHSQYLGGTHGEVPFTTDYSQVQPKDTRKVITLDNLLELQMVKNYYLAPN